MRMTIRCLSDKIFGILETIHGLPGIHMIWTLDHPMKDRIILRPQPEWIQRKRTVMLFLMTPFHSSSGSGLWIFQYSSWAFTAYWYPVKKPFNLVIKLLLCFFSCLFSDPVLFGSVRPSDNLPERRFWCRLSPFPEESYFTAIHRWKLAQRLNSACCIPDEIIE